MSLFKNSLVLSCLILCTSCYAEKDYQYWIMHPAELEKAYSQCQLMDSSYCVDVKKAANDLGPLVYEQAMNPQLVGKQIMELQQELQTLKQTNGDVKRQQDLAKELKIIYAVVAMHGPE